MGLPARGERYSHNASQMETSHPLNFSKLIQFIYLGFPGWGKYDLHAIDPTFQGLVWIEGIKSNAPMFKMGKQDGNSPWFFQDAGTGWGEAGKANKVTLLPLDHTVAL